ncbi:MAG: gamma-glutamylcyclotransferase [Burkholderiaceae bacterium]
MAALIDGEDTIHAEAYKVNDYTLHTLDEIESNGYLYERRSGPDVVTLPLRRLGCLACRSKRQVAHPAASPTTWPVH